MKECKRCEKLKKKNNELNGVIRFYKNHFQKMNKMIERILNVNPHPSLHIRHDNYNEK